MSNYYTEMDLNDKWAKVPIYPLMYHVGNRQLPLDSPALRTFGPTPLSRYLPNSGPIATFAAVTSADSLDHDYLSIAQKDDSTMLLYVIGGVALVYLLMRRV